jgi:outer membrane biosynthesis protein TonB
MMFFKDPYANPKRARAILFGVLLLHVGVIAVPLIYASLTDFFDPPVIVMKVGLADLPPGDSPDAGAVADASSPKTAEPDPVSVDDIPDPQKVDDLPPDLPPPPPKVDPPKQKTDAKTPDEQPPPKPKTDTKATVKPKADPPKTQTKQDSSKPKTLLDTKDILIAQNTKTKAQIDAERKAREAAEAKAKAAAEERRKALAELRNTAAGTGAQQGRFGTDNPGQQGILATKEMREYYEQLNAFIRPKWNAVSPSSIELNGSVSNWPTIALSIEKNGRLKDKTIVRKSGNKAIDAAVDALLANLTAVPVPPQAAVIHVTLDIR